MATITEHQPGVYFARESRAIVQAMLLAWLRRCDVLGLRHEDLHLDECRVCVANGEGGHERLVPIDHGPPHWRGVTRRSDRSSPA